MARPPKPESERRIPFGGRLSPDLYHWAEARIGPGKEFKDMTHALERGLATLRELEEGRLARVALKGGIDIPSDVRAAEFSLEARRADLEAAGATKKRKK